MVTSSVLLVLMPYLSHCLYPVQREHTLQGGSPLFSKHIANVLPHVLTY